MSELNTYPPERRLFTRTQLQMRVQVLRMDPYEGDLVDNLQMVDISRGGIGTLSDKPFYPGQRLVLKMPAPGMDVRSITGVVRRCQRKDEKFVVGIEFDHPIASLCVDRDTARTTAAAA